MCILVSSVTCFPKRAMLQCLMERTPVAWQSYNANVMSFAATLIEISIGACWFSGVRRIWLPQCPILGEIVEKWAYTSTCWSMVIMCDMYSWPSTLPQISMSTGRLGDGAALSKISRLSLFIYLFIYLQ